MLGEESPLGATGPMTLAAVRRSGPASATGLPARWVPAVSRR